MANLEAEAVVMVELITMDAVTAGLIIEVTATTNTISIMVMIMTTMYIMWWLQSLPQTLF